MLTLACSWYEGCSLAREASRLPASWAAERFARVTALSECAPNFCELPIEREEIVMAHVDAAVSRDAYVSEPILGWLALTHR